MPSIQVMNWEIFFRNVRPFHQSHFWLHVVCITYKHIHVCCSDSRMSASDQVSYG